ncbi:MAG: hypothetical protein J1E29_01140 [Duncaniella sp.]|nr:hypothetical protein [Duncaniella sp.]
MIRHSLKHIAHALLLASLPLAVAAQQPADADTDAEEVDVVVTDDDESELLAAGVVEIPGEADDIDIPIPSFIRRSANHIIYNGADWSALRRAFERSDKAPVSIVLIGDSHIQADISSGTTRDLLQYDFGNAGRGLVSPLKISGTNEPSNYFFQSRNSWIPVKLMSSTWRQTVGFTGCSIRPSSSSSEFTIGTSEKDDYNPFTSVTVFHSGRFVINSVRGESDDPLQFRSIPSRDYTQILLPSPQTRITIDFASAGDLTVFGASLSGDRPGVFYHAIGNNGAAYETYNRIGTVGAGIAPLNPALVIVSLGTNEAFGRLDTSAFTRAVNRLVSNIRTANPDALILLTTPMECQKSVTTTKKVRVRSKKKGQKARTVNRTSRSYAVNHNIAPIRQAILDYGKQNGIAVYDWYDIAGGQGASNTWVAHNLFAKDRVHHTHAAYRLEGRLLYEAIMDALRSN